MKAKESSSPLKQAFWLCLASLLGWVLIFPEISFHRGISFLMWGDCLLDFFSTFTLTGFFYQGGIQLWDFFGQLPHTFFWVTHGMFRIPNVLSALVYVLLSPFADNSARFFDSVFSIVYFGSFLCVRTIGIFLLLKRFTDDKWILGAGSVIFALFFSPTTMISGMFYQHFFPLLMYFILSFFLTWRLIYLGMAVLFMVISLSQGVVHTFCMYLGINFFAISCCIYSLFVHRSTISRWQDFFKNNSRSLLMGSLGLLILTVIIMGPYVYMFLFCLKDVAFGIDHSRLTGMWNIANYFHGYPPLDQTVPSDYFRRMLDFTFEPGRSFFLGYMMFFLSGLGLAMSPDRRKWIFVLTIFLIWSVNFPRETFSIGLIGHWLNALTNPFKVMVTSYQMASNACFWFLLMPLVVMGLGVLKDLGQGVSLQFSRLRNFALFMIVFAVNGASHQPAIVKTYFFIDMAISLMALALLIWAGKQRPMRRIAITAFACLILMDMHISAWDMKHYLTDHCNLRPHLLEEVPQQTGPVGLDFHNPKIFPFVGQSDMIPVVAQSYLWTLRDLSLNFNSVINRQTALVPIESHSPRHIAFQGWVDDPLMKEYLAQNNKLFFFAGYGVRSGPGIFEKIVRHKLTSDVMMVEAKAAPSLRGEIPSQITPLPPGEDQWLSIPADAGDDDRPGWTYENGMAIWDFPLPGAIPDYFASNVFTHDKWVRFFIQTPDQKYSELAPVQGQLLMPMTFDVQNIKEGKVFVALPANMPLRGLRGILLLKTRDASGITSIWRHHSDETGITFQAPADGWLGIQFPYDPKWRIEVDGQSVRFYRADKSFIGLPVTRGEHKILIQYWPDSWLRWGLPLSVMLATILFIFLIFYALHEASSIHHDEVKGHE